MKILFLDLSCTAESINALSNRAVGGMVTSLFKVSDALSKQNKVFVMANIKESGITAAGTTWISADHDPQIVLDGKWDYLVFNRGIGLGAKEIRAKRRILWTHDLPHMGFAPEPDVWKIIDGTVFMSRYAEDIWRTFYPQIGRGFQIPNGVDKGLFYPRRKDMDYLIYFCHPIRGLKRVPLIFTGIKERMLPRKVYLKAFSSFYPNDPLEDDHMDKYQTGWEVTEDGNPEGLTITDSIPQEKLAEELGRASLMLMPTGFPEICSNSILQSLACGTPVLTTGNLGSAGEWVKHGVNGWFTRFQPCDYVVYLMEFTRAAIKILSSEDMHKTMISNCVKTENLLTWEEVGEKWSEMIGG